MKSLYVIRETTFSVAQIPLFHREEMTKVGKGGEVRSLVSVCFRCARYVSHHYVPHERFLTNGGG